MGFERGTISLKRVLGLDFHEIRMGHSIWIISLMPVTIFMIGTELMLDVSTMGTSLPVEQLTGTSGSVINYVSVIISHAILCAWFFVTSFRKKYEHFSPEKESHIKRGMIISLGVVFITFTCIVFFADLNIEVLSHQHVYKYFKENHFIKFLFSTVFFSETKFSFYLFSVIPFGAVLFGLTCISFASFELAIHTVRLNNIQTDEELSRLFETIFSDIKSCFVKVIIVLATSSIATSLYFMIPYSGPEVSPREYLYFAKAMSVYWGIIYTFTISSFFIIPYLCYKKKIEHISLAKATGDMGKYYSYHIEHKGYIVLSANMRFVVSAFLPLVVSIIAPLFA